MLPEDVDIGRTRRPWSLADGSSAAETLALLEATLDSIQEGVLVTDPEGRVVDYNDRFLELWSIPEHLAERGDDEELLAYVEDQLEDPKAFRERVEELYDDPTAVSEDEIHFEDERVFERISRPQVVRGEPVGRVWSFRDVTEDVEARTELEESNGHLENFASMVSHDLREPLRGVVQRLQLLDRELDGGLSEAARQHLSLAEETAKRSHEMVQGLHRLSSIRRERSEAEEVPLEHVVDAALVQLEEPIEAADATFEIGTLPSVSGDPAQFATLFQNLVKNAIDHSGERPVRVEIDSDQVGDQVEVRVRDQGPGIPEEEQTAIFEAFQQAGSTHEDGQGLGLALCRRIVEGHGGEISVDSTPGEGATFVFTLPTPTDRPPGPTS